MPEMQSLGVKPHEESGIIYGDFEAGFACTALTKSERKRNLFNRVDAAAYENLKQELEAC